MKTILLFAFIFLASELFATELSWVDKQVSAIKPSRHGLKSSAVASLKNPFIFLKKNSSKKNKKNVQKNVSVKSFTRAKSIRKYKRKPTRTYRNLTLEAIINKSALINGHWYKIGKKVRGYKLTDVSNVSVTLTKNKKKIVLSVIKTHKKLNFKK